MYFKMCLIDKALLCYCKHTLWLKAHENISICKLNARVHGTESKMRCGIVDRSRTNYRRVACLLAPCSSYPKTFESGEHFLA